MSRPILFALFYLAVFLQAGAYGLTFMLPRLFDAFGANEKMVGGMLFITTISTLIAVYYSGHLADRFGRLRTLGGACFAIAAALTFYGLAQGVGVLLISASILLGAGWGLTYALPPVVVTRLISAQDRVRYFAILSVAVMTGFGLSPVLASMLEDAGFTIADAFYITAALCALAGLIFFTLTTPIRQQAAAKGPEARSNLSLSAITDIMRSPARLPVIMVCLGASVFAGMNNFQTVFADERGLDYADYFLTYTITVVLFRVVLARFKGGRNPYLTIAALMYVMCGSVVLFLLSGASVPLYLLTAILFGIGYGVSYPILAAMAANDAKETLLPQTLQFFALTYFIGIFGFPLIAGWLIVEAGSATLLLLVAVLAGVEATMALRRSLAVRVNATLQSQ
ncbi:MFS transporter [Roseovarius sp. EL26]|uniref:MFS transporter n=1 Tax=Roseovarius sp. EL26 TaxID=2126672 RepID=UPI000EA19A11|nr:MFS transporter [Roseovarius sp. EL26]